MVRYLVEQFEQKEQLARGYDLVYTPHIASEKIYQTSGHLETYRENMYSPMSIEEVDYYLKPMNCPGHIMIYKSRVHSYRDLPDPAGRAGHGLPLRALRDAARHAARARLHAGRLPHLLHAGAGRRRGGRGDRPGDAHGRRLRLRLPGVSGDAAGEVDRRATRSGRRRPKTCGGRWRFAGSSYKIDEGGGAFYGPKIDIKWVDALGREWTGPTIQVDFNLPERFDVNYIGEDGERHRVAMIHRTLLGSMERFVGGLIEHYAGAFPLWLAPVQAAIIPITDDQIAYARDVGADARRRGTARRSRRPARPHAGQDPRSAAAEDPVHAGHRQARGG